MYHFVTLHFLFCVLENTVEQASEVLDAIEEENSSFDKVNKVVIESQKVRGETDKYSGNKELFPGAVNHLTGLQLLAPANARSQNENIEDSFKESPYPSEEITRSKKRKKIHHHKYISVLKSNSLPLPLFPEPN